MDISDFVIPNHHPHEMLNGYAHAYEKESFLAFMLKRSIDAGGFVGIQTMDNEDDMVELGLLDKTGEQEYKLSKKAIGLLYTQYHS